MAGATVRAGSDAGSVEADPPPGPAQGAVDRLRRIADRVGVAAPLRHLRHAPDRLLHPLRRLRAERRVRELAAERFLVVCEGNVCRSPYAAAVLEREAGRRAGRPIQVRSVGLTRPGRASPDEARRVAAERDVDLGEHRSRLLGGSDVAWADLFLVMNATQRRAVTWSFGGDRGRVVLLGDLDPRPIRRRTILDPVLRPEEVFRQVYGRVDRCVRNLVDQLERIPPERADGGESRARRTEDEPSGRRERPARERRRETTPTEGSRR